MRCLLACDEKREYEWEGVISLLFMYKRTSPCAVMHEKGNFFNVRSLFAYMKQANKINKIQTRKTTCIILRYYFSLVTLSPSPSR
jgi:hypothetical protein